MGASASNTKDNNTSIIFIDEITGTNYNGTVQEFIPHRSRIPGTGYITERYLQIEFENNKLPTIKIPETGYGGVSTYGEFFREYVNKDKIFEQNNIRGMFYKPPINKSGLIGGRRNRKSKRSKKHNRKNNSRKSKATRRRRI